MVRPSMSTALLIDNTGIFDNTSRGVYLVGDFTVHAFEGRDLILQTAPRPPRPVEYALARRLANGVYLVVPIDEAVANEAARARFCTQTSESSCRVTTPEQLFVFAHAMADNAEGYPATGIVVVVPSGRR